MLLKQKTKARLTFDEDDWDVSGTEYEAELADAVEQAREDHDAEVVVNAKNTYIFKVQWNEKTESVWVSVYGYSLGMEVDD